MHVLVTGATGFIGRALIEELRGDPSIKKIYGTTRQKSQASTLKKQGIVPIVLDLSSGEAVDRLARLPVDYACHCAGEMQSLESARLRRNTIKATENLCSWALLTKIRRMVYVSSAAVVSGNRRKKLTDALPYRACDAYGKAKIEAEKSVISYREQGLPVVVLRPCSVYGERDPHFFPLIAFLIRSRAVPLSYFRRMSWHGLYIRNLTALIHFALSKKNMEQGTFLAADTDTIQFREYESFVSSYLKRRGSRSSGNVSMNDIKERLTVFLRPREYDITGIMNAGFSHPFSAHDGFLRTVSVFLPGFPSQRL